MTITTITPAPGDIKFLKRLDNDLPASAADLLPTIATFAATSTSSATSGIDASNVNSKLQEVAQRQMNLEKQLEGSIKAVDGKTSQIIKQLENCIQEKESLSRLLTTSQPVTPSFAATAVSPSAMAPLNLLSAASPSNIPIRLVHEDHSDTENRPLLHRRVQIYSLGWFTSTLIAERITDQDGRLNFEYTLGQGQEKPLRLYVHEELLPTKELSSRVGSVFRVVFSTDFIPTVASQQLNVALYEYPPRNEKYLPRLKQPRDPKQRPQQDTSDYESAILSAGIGPELIKNTTAKLAFTVGQIEFLYGVLNSTLKLDSKTTVELLLNGIHPCNFLRAPQDSGSEYYVDINWDKYCRCKIEIAAFLQIRNCRFSQNEFILRKCGGSSWRKSYKCLKKKLIGITSSNRSSINR